MPAVTFPRFATVIFIGAVLVAAFLVDATIGPPSHFTLTPFAIPILSATARLSFRETAQTTAVVTVVAAVSAYFRTASLLPSTLNLFGLIIIGVLAILLGEQRETAVRRTDDAEGARSQVASILESISVRNLLRASPTLARRSRVSVGQWPISLSTTFLAR